MYKMMITVFTAVLLAGHAFCAELPAHGSAVMNKSQRPAQLNPDAGDAPVDGGLQILINKYIGIDDDDLLDEPYGLELGYEFPVSDRGGCRIGIGYEQWEFDDGTSDDDINMIPLGFSLYYLLVAGRGWGIMGDAGIRYFTASSSLDLDDDDALALRFNLDARLSFNESISAGIRLGYQAEIDDMEIESHNISPAGWIAGLGIFGIL